MERSPTKGRMMLIGLVVVFALPAIIAKVVLSQNWYESGVTNYGELVEGQVNMSSLGIEVENQGWLLGYVVPETCSDLCQKQLHILSQSHIALGKYKERVSPTLLVTNQSDQSWLLEQKDSSVQLMAEEIAPLQEATIVIVDPLGQLVMQYPSVKDESELVAQSKGMLSDLRKLLKLSRVG